MSARPVGVLGGGRWGVALARASRAAGRDVVLCTRREPEVPSDGIEVTADMAVLGRRAGLILVAVPSSAARVVLRALGDVVDGSHLIVHGVRGLSEGGLLPLSELVRQETPVRRVGALGGPVLAEDLLEGRPSVIATASRYVEVNEAVRDALAGPSLRVYTTADLTGLEWASAMMGVLMVALGYARGTGVSPALIAALMTRAVHETARVAAAAGADERTFFGLAGFGDLMAAMGQSDRPEVAFGRALAEGIAPESARRAMPHRIEAPDLVPRVVEFARNKGVSAPILEALDGLLSARLTKDEILRNLMTASLVRGA